MDQVRVARCARARRLPFSLSTPALPLTPPLLGRSVVALWQVVQFNPDFVICSLNVHRLLITR